MRTCLEVVLWERLQSLMSEYEPSSSVVSGYQTQIIGGGLIQEKLPVLHQVGTSQWEQPGPARSQKKFSAMPLSRKLIFKTNKAFITRLAIQVHCHWILFTISANITYPLKGLASVKHHITASYDTTRNFYSILYPYFSALFTITRRWKWWAKYSSVDKELNKIWYIYMKIYYLTIKSDYKIYYLTLCKYYNIDEDISLSEIIKLLLKSNSNDKFQVICILW